MKLNREIGPRGPLELRMKAGFWQPKGTRTFPELLDTVEAGLRAGFLQAEPRVTGRRKGIGAMKTDAPCNELLRTAEMRVAFPFRLRGVI